MLSLSSFYPHTCKAPPNKKTCTKDAQLNNVSSYLSLLILYILGNSTLTRYTLSNDINISKYYIFVFNIIFITNYIDIIQFFIYNITTYI